MEDIKWDSLITLAQTIRVLYIEPNEKLRKDIFDVFFHNIDIAIDGEDGYQCFQNNKYDLIITSMKMPKMSGIELIAKIREVSKDISILVISTQTDYFVDLIKLGIDGFILKPIEIAQFTSIVSKVIEKIQNKAELYHYRTNLEHKVEEEIFKRTRSEKMLLQQSRLALMGEMMDAVAHQWKQPINIINMNVDMLQYDFEDKLIDQEYITSFQKDISTQVLHMNHTLNEFRSFFRPDKVIVPFSIKTALESILLLMKDEIMKYSIQIDIEIEDDFLIEAIENEFKHVIINLINNAKDVFKHRKRTSNTIKIQTKIEDNKKKITILDNAGGIPENIIKKIFEANFTTKEKENGTGIGLYMSKIIVEKYHGTISVLNDKKAEIGALFIITF